jgi:tetratricopeptide (TPR) repeat protein
MKHLALFFSLLFFAVLSHAQLSSKDEKKYTNAEKLFDKGKGEDAEKILLKLAQKYPQESRVWNLLTDVQYYNYRVLKKKDKSMNFTVTVKDKDGNVKEDDSLANKLVELLNANKPSVIYFKTFINTCRDATLHDPKATKPSMMLRNFYVDAPVDTAIKEEAWKFFNKAENEFQERNYSNAVGFYKKAIEADSSFYKAKLYLGDTYYHLKDYPNAVKYFRSAVAERPDLLEPRKYLVDALFYMGARDSAMSECINAIICYPDASLFIKYRDGARHQGKDFKRYWVERKVFPNKVGNKEPVAPAADLPWKHYQDALKDIEPYCDSRGVINKSNTLTKSLYAEVYAWEHMLKNTPEDKFEAARKLQKLGYLDCYVMVSLFHFDLWDQYKSFAATNKERIKAFMELLLTL